MLQSPIFEITLSGDIYALKLPIKPIRPFLEQKLNRVRVMATYKTNTLSFHGAIQKRKGGYVMMFGKRYQKELGISTNEVLQVQFFEDTSTYGVELPEEFEAVMFTDDVAHQIFESLTKGTQRGLIYTILRIKNSETRIEKTLLLCENLKRGIRESKQLFQR